MSVSLAPAVLLSMQALISFVGDCSDAALVEDVLSTLCALLRRDSLARMPLLVCLQQLGGPALFLSLVRWWHEL